jgi:orotate phosphoribosyltransferase
VDVLKSAELQVEGMVSIFNYGFDEAKKAFDESGVRLKSLTDYPSLIELAISQNSISEDDHQQLLQWRKDPSNWRAS